MDQIVFTGVWGDRAAGMRQTFAEETGPRLVVPLWRGRPLVAGDDLGWVPPDHPVLVHAPAERVFLGTDGGFVRLAADVSGWEPAGLDPAQMAMFLDSTRYLHPSLPADHAFVDLRLAMTTLAAGPAAMASTARALFNWHRSHRFCSACGARSDWAMGGWQRDCGACGARHFPRTDPVVIMLVRRGNAILMGRSPGWPEGMYSALAGFVEPGETLETAVRREVFEETGVRVGAVRYLASQPWPFPNSLMMGCVAEAETDAITLDAELDDALWITREDMVDIMIGAHPVITPPRTGAIAHWLTTSWLAGRLD